MADAIIMPGEIERSCGHATPTSSMIIQPFLAFALAARIAAAALIVVASVASAAARDRASAGVEHAPRTGGVGRAPQQGLQAMDRRMWRDEGVRRAPEICTGLARRP